MTRTSDWKNDFGKQCHDDPARNKTHYAITMQNINTQE